MAVASVGGGGATPNYVTQMGGNLHPFLFVGCWNLVGEPRDAVISAMLTTAAEKGIKNIVLGGDNVYPLPEDDAILKKIKKAKEKGEKWMGEKPPKHRVKTFTDGIASFAGFRLIMALGNHNVENAPVRTAEEELLPFNHSYYVAEFEDAAIVVFDANILKGDEEFHGMKEWLSSVLSYLKGKGKAYYFVTHEPFGSFKKGKHTIWGISKDSMGNEATIEAGSTPAILSTLQTHLPLAVLCADTHHYEEGVISGGDSGAIRQIIVGSGGASFNDYTHPATPFSLGGPFLYSMTSEPVSKYGFLLLEDAASTAFIPAWNWSGGKRKTRRGRRRNHKKLTRRAHCRS
jgi:hypothetical protein